MLLLEARRTLGGRARFEEREGFVLDYGIHGHRFGGSGPAARVFAEMGESLELIKPSGGVIYHRGKVFESPSRPLDMLRTPLLPAGTKAAVGRAVARIAWRNPTRIYRRTVGEMLPRRFPAEARFFVSVICGLGLISPDLAETSAGELSWFLRRVARAEDPLAFPVGGCRQHVRRLSGKILESGEIRTGVRVERVLVEDGSAAGVECRQGLLRSRAVVLALPLPRAAELVPPGVLGSALEARMKAIRPTAGLSWDVAISRKLTDVHTATCTEPLVIGAFTSNIDVDMSPPGRQLSTWCMPLPLSEFRSAGTLRREEERLRKTVFDMFPSLEENLLWERMQRLPVIDGAVPAHDQPWPARPGVADSGVPGEGGDIAFRSALECAGAVRDYG